MPPTAIQKVQLCDINKPPPSDQVAIATLQDLFESRQGALQKIAAKHLTPDRLARIAVNCVSKTPKLLECTPISILSSVMAGAAMGLEAGGPLQHGFLVPRFNGRKKVMECHFLVGYRGLIDLARRSGSVLSIEADVVYGNDDWGYSKTEMGASFSHVPFEGGDPGEVRLAYAVARLKDTPIPIVAVMMRRELDAIRDRDQRRGESPWDSDFPEMSKKTAIRRIAKYLPMSIEMANCLDQEAEEEDREIIDIAPARSPKQERKTKSEDAISSGVHVDTSESQEVAEIEPIADVLRGIEALSTEAECSAHSERLKKMHWHNDKERSQAAVAMKKRWKAVTDAAKTRTACEACGLLGSHANGCPNGPPFPDWSIQDDKDRGEAFAAATAKAEADAKARASIEGDQIQGREPGSDDD